MTRTLLICTCLISLTLMSPRASSAADTRDREATRQANAERRAEASRESDARREEARRNREAAKAQQRSRKEAAASSGDGKRASNDSMETQRRTAQAMAEKQRGATDESKLRPPTTAPSGATEATRISASDPDKQLRDEETRHAKAMDQLNRDLAAAKASRDRAATKAAQAAIDKELASYKKRRTELEQQKRPSAAPAPRTGTISKSASPKSDKPALESSREYKP
jgi:colicin import membrane protein